MSMASISIAKDFLAVESCDSTIHGTGMNKAIDSHFHLSIGGES